MYGREKLTIKNLFSNVCFHQKMLSNQKAWTFTHSENLPGKDLKHTSIRENRRFSAVRKNGGVELKITPETKKRSEARAAENLENGPRGWKKTVDHFFIFQ